eukprot:NODE_6431_length_506_cov_370.946785.p1 GENE.NODE_6431_length_506_cov_370.946785~~NODE_6431_length_506_cov_370.946785.p1  ORF type:complete len:92 (-),score=3.30 NODE_6431_length_506_cov_370.946785:104-379(-)
MTWQHFELLGITVLARGIDPRCWPSVLSGEPTRCTLALCVEGIWGVVGRCAGIGGPHQSLTARASSPSPAPLANGGNTARFTLCHVCSLQG